MARWLLLTACSITSLGLLGCGPLLTVGLANGPQLGGSRVADARVTDAVSNGTDACRPVGEGSALRGKLPPCPVIERNALVPLMITIHDPVADGVVASWVRHFYVDWPCQTPRPDDGRTLAALGTLPVPVCKP